MPDPRWNSRRASRVVTSVVSVLIAIAGGVIAGSGLVVYSTYPAGGYGSFSTNVGMAIPTPGNTDSLSPNAGVYAKGTVLFSSSVSGCAPPHSFNWTFGDGTYSTEPNVGHVYCGPGNETGPLKNRDSAGH